VLTSVVVALATVSSPLGGDVGVDAPRPLGELYDPMTARGEHAAVGEARALSKREEWLRDKELRPDLHLWDAALAAGRRAATAAEREAARRRKRSDEAGAPAAPLPFPGVRTEPITTLFNVWTREALPILPGDSPETRFHSFLRDHYTNQARLMDTRLIDVLIRAARKFSAERIEVVSGYRSPKYNLMLRKKGHQVARESQHMEGHAVDFRIRGVPTKSLLHFVKSLRLGGVGFYPHSQFIHSDTGRIRYWQGS